MNATVLADRLSAPSEQVASEGLGRFVIIGDGDLYEVGKRHHHGGTAADLQPRPWLVRTVPTINRGQVAEPSRAQAQCHQVRAPRVEVAVDRHGDVRYVRSTRPRARAARRLMRFPQSEVLCHTRDWFFELS
jgi:hypothetical protein